MEASPDAAAAAAGCRAEELLVPEQRWCPGGIPAWRNGGGCEEGAWTRNGGTSCGLRGIPGPPVLGGAGGRRWCGGKSGLGGDKGGGIGRIGAAEAKRGGALAAPDAAAGNAGGSVGWGGIPGGGAVSLLGSPGTALECDILVRRSTV